MDKNILIQHVDKGKSTRQIASSLNCSQGTVKYWLKKYGLKTIVSKNIHCVLCTKPTQRGRKYCGGCNTKIRRYRAKKAAVYYLGEKCRHCNWMGPVAGFSFHHIEKKSFEISSVANKAWPVIKQELKKCILLCATCHAIEHSNVYDNFLEAVENYKGNLLTW